MKCAHIFMAHPYPALVTHSKTFHLLHPWPQPPLPLRCSLSHKPPAQLGLLGGCHGRGALNGECWLAFSHLSQDYREVSEAFLILLLFAGTVNEQWVNILHREHWGTRIKGGGGRCCGWKCYGTSIPYMYGHHNHVGRPPSLLLQS